MLADCYPAMKKWISYLSDHSEGGLVVREEEGGWCLGDWCTYDRCAIPEPFVNTYYFVRCLHLMAEIARILGCDGDIACYQALADESRAALCDTYYADGHFCGGIQGADAYALDLELVPAQIGDVPAFTSSMADELAAKYDALGRFDTGFLGTDILLRVLFAAGHADTAYRLLSADVRGSFLYMKRNNATTLWEDWHGGGSHNHPMFGAPVRYLFSEFLGIHRITPGWGKVLIDPILPAGLDTVAGSITTPHGALSVSLVRENGIIRAEITVPDGIDAAFLCGDKKTPLVGGVNRVEF
jgi:alpha-L-rhamnosidase